MNMLDFVRIKLNNQEFVNANGATQGSRASAKFPWLSRIDLIDSNNDGIWQRNPSLPDGNLIGPGYIGLGIAP